MGVRDYARVTRFYCTMYIIDLQGPEIFGPAQSKKYSENRIGPARK